MEIVARDGVLRVWRASLRRPYSFVSPFERGEFVVLIVADDQTIVPHEQMRLSAQLVEQGCRYVIATGHEASSWDDSVDYAFIESDPNQDPPDDRFVMTVWLENESADEIAEFFLLNTAFDSFVPTNFLVLGIGKDRSLQQEIEDAVVRTVGATYS